MPVERTTGDGVYSGTMVELGALEIEVTAVARAGIKFYPQTKTKPNQIRASSKLKIMTFNLSVT